MSEAVEIGSATPPSAASAADAVPASGTAQSMTDSAALRATVRADKLVPFSGEYHEWFRPRFPAGPILAGGAVPPVRRTMPTAGCREISGGVARHVKCASRDNQRRFLGTRRPSQGLATHRISATLTLHP